MEQIFNVVSGFFQNTGIAGFFIDGGWRYLIMIALACILIFLAIKKQFEPYLLLPIAFGMLLVNLPGVREEVFKTTYSISYPDGYYTVEQFVALIGNDHFTKELAIKLFQLGGLDITKAYQVGTIVAPIQGIVTPEVVALFKVNDINLINVINDTFKTTSYSGLLGYLYYGVKLGIYPCLIFLCIGATTDFGPLIANKKTMILGGAAQIGIFLTFTLAILFGFTPKEAASIGIIGGADGPTAILVTSNLAPDLLGSISIAAYSYMALVPVIFPPIIKLLTTKKERAIKMEQSRPVSKREKILFPIIVAVVVILLVPSCAPLIGCLMLGNLIKESGVVPKIVDAVSNSLMYIVTILLGVCVGATTNADSFLTVNTLLIFALGIGAFIISASCGLLFGKLMCFITKGKVNPMIGAAGVSAVPMAARVVHKVGQEEDPSNFLLMHAMGPNVAGVIGSAVAAGVLMLLFA